MGKNRKEEQIARESLWQQPFSISQQDYYTWQLKDTVVGVKRCIDGWMVCNRKGETAVEDWEMCTASECPECEGWTRFIVGEAEGRLQFVPTVPDKSIVLRPNTSIKLLPGKTVTFFVEVPILVQLVSKGERSTSLLTEICLSELSHIWFGNPVEGELCYALDVPILTEEPESGAGPFQVMITVHIKNNSSLQLDLQKFCLRCEYLYIYEIEGTLWTDEVTYQFRGAEQSSQISFSKKPPKGKKEAVLLSQPRAPAVQSLIKRSFNILKSVTGL